MMQRKNRSKLGGSENGSGHESNNDNSNSNSNNNNHTTNDDKSKSSPSKPPAPPSGSGVGMSIAALTGHHNHTPYNTANNNNNSNNCGNSGCTSSHPTNTNTTSSKSKKPKVAIATVKRNRCGTQPFDKNWLNLDCCGLICAGLTYCLHGYGVYSFGWILLPPWFSIMDEDGYRALTFGCHFHRTLFITIAFLAVFAHYKAMTTDPGAVPPDANPLPDLDELDNLIKGERSVESSPRTSPGKQSRNATNVGMNGMERGMVPLSQSSSLMQEDSSLDVYFPGKNNHGSLLDNTTNNNNHTNGMNINNNNNNNNNGHGLPQAVATAGLVGAAVVGAAGIAGAAAVAGAAAAAAPIRPNVMPNGSTMPPVSGQPRGRRMCRRCQAFKPPRAHHCSICKRCIIKMDHHCPWVNNCVGIGNHKYFLLFIFYTSLSCAYSFLFVIYRMFHCMGQVKSHHHGPRCVDHPTDLLPLVGLVAEALLFGLFTLCMMVDQWDVVLTNITHIDRLKGEHHHGHGHPQHGGGGYRQLPQQYNTQNNNQVRNLMNSARAGINEVFGTGRHILSSLSSSPSAVLPTSRFHYTWLSPLHKVCFPDTVRDDIFGYCRPTCGGGASAASCGAGGVIVEGARRISKSMEMMGRGNGETGRGVGVGAAEIV